MQSMGRIEPTGRGSEVQLVGPEVCPNGHALVYPNVLISSNVEAASYTCLTCGLVTHVSHSTDDEWVTDSR